MSESGMAQQLARAASAFEQQRTGHVPRSVTVVVSGDKLVITLDGALSVAETLAGMTPEGAAAVREYHRQLFETSSDTLREEITRITGIGVVPANPGESTAGTIVPVFATGAIVQVVLLTGSLPTETWSGPV